MRLTIKEPDIEIGVDGFKGHCQLSREVMGEKLSELVEKIQDPIVIALDGSWGSGKSFFLKCWAGAHKHENDGKAKVIYFDAFQHDFLDDPLVSLVSALLPEFKDSTESVTAISKIKSASMKLGGPLARIGLAVGTSGLSELSGPIIDALISSSGKEFEKLVDGMWVKEEGRINAMKEFRAALKELTQPDENGEPTQKIVIIIDELDRCRPDYALSMLEVMKHFFAVDNVIFVLGVNLTELQNSVKARYGAGIDAENYLRKFITLSMGLPAHIGEFEKIEVGLFYFDWAASELGISKKISDSVKEYLNSIRNSTPPSIREIQRLLSILVLIPSKVRNDDTDNLYPGFHSCIAGLAVLKCFYPSLYKKVPASQLTYADIGNTFDFFNTEGEISNSYQQRVWAEILEPDRIVKEVSGNHQSGFGPYGLRGQEGRLAKLAEDYLEAFELLEEAPQS